jgi:hypothetical protein
MNWEPSPAGWKHWKVIEYAREDLLMAFSMGRFKPGRGTTDKLGLPMQRQAALGKS